MIKLNLFPQRFRIPGMIGSAVFLILGILVLHFEFSLDWLSLSKESGFLDSNQNFTDELIGLGLILSLLLAGFSKTKQEDEYTALLRLKSLVIAMYASAILFILACVFVYGFNFLTALIYIFFFPFIAQILLFEIKRKRS